MIAWIKKLLLEGAISFGLIRRPELIQKQVSDHPLPETMDAGILYIVGGPGYQKWAVFRCPKHEDEIIQLSLMANRRPRWTVSPDFFDRPTIHPSVRQMEGSFAHFWVKSGRVEWCGDSGRAPSLQSDRERP